MFHLSWSGIGSTDSIHTVARQVAVEELGVEPDRIKVVVDTTRELGAGQTTGSRGTVMGAGSVADACRNAMAGGCEEGVEYEGVYVIDWTNSINDGLENPVIHSTFGYAAQLVELDPETGEIGLVPTAGAVAAALHAHDDEWRHELPMRTERNRERASAWS